MVTVDPTPDDWSDSGAVRELDRTLEYAPPTPEQRLLDVLGALLCLAVTAPVFAVVALYYLGRAVLRGGSASPFQTERRISGGDPFTLYKFRTLKRPVDDEETIKSHETSSETTVIGRLLIRVYMDELPQVYNILRGDMRLVGPRPWAVQEAKEERRTTGLRRKFLCRAGLTGPDQVRKGYPDRHTGYEGDYQYIYIQNHGGRVERLRYDLELLAQSIRPILEAEGK